MPCFKRDQFHLFSANNKVCYNDFFVCNQNNQFYSNPCLSYYFLVLLVPQKSMNTLHDQAKPAWLLSFSPVGTQERHPQFGTPQGTFCQLSPFKGTRVFVLMTFLFRSLNSQKSFCRIEVITHSMRSLPPLLNTCQSY